MSFTTLIWENERVKKLKVVSSTVDLAFSVQIVAFMALMRERKIAPFRGCYWHFGFDDHYDTDDGSLPYYRLRGFADGSEAGGSLAQGIVREADDLDIACARVVAKFRQACGKWELGVTRENPWITLAPLDGVPWEIHMIEDRIAYASALVSYRENRL